MSKVQAFQLQGKTLQYIAVHPDGYDPEKDYPLVILLHGFGASMSDLVGLAPDIDRENYVYVFPNGPLAVSIGPEMTGYSWIPPHGTATPEDIRLSEELLATFFDEVMEKYRVPPSRVVLGGFSQGGGMTYRCGLGRPDVFAGLVVLSSGLSDTDEVRGRLPPQRTQPIFVAHGTQDSVAPFENAQQAIAFLEAEGYHPEFRQYATGHEISQDVLDDLAPWLHNTLPPEPLPPPAPG